MARITWSRSTVNALYWRAVGRFDKKRYLRHEAETNPYEGEEFKVDLLRIESDEYVNRAKRANVTVPSHLHWLTPYEEADDFHHLSASDLTKLKQIVHAAEDERIKRRREGREHWIK